MNEDFITPLMPQRRIGIEARMLGVGGTGVSTYARSLLAALARIECAPVLVGEARWRSGRFIRALRALPLRARRLVAMKAGQPGTAEQLAAGDVFRIAQVHFNIHGRLLPLEAPGPPGIMHWTYPVPLRMIGWHNVYTVHDAIPHDQPELTPIDGRRHARLLAAIIGHADALVTVSAAARAAIVAATGCAEAFVVDCGQPVIVPAGPPPVPAGLASREYFLFCGSIEPRKNLVRLAAAYRASGSTLPLLLVGPDGWRAGEVLAAIGLDDRVRRLPYQDRTALIGLIAHARALLFPSLAEGFGLPVAEAMALGTPVLTSAGGALAETAGGAALLVDPMDQAAMAAAITRLAGEDMLTTELAARGRERAADFSLDRFARRLDALYARVAPGAPAG